MFQSGSLTAGVDPNDWELPPGTALRYEVPDAKLRPFFASYAVLGGDAAIYTGTGDWVLPGWAQLWIVLTRAPIEASMRLGSVPLATVVVFGGTSQVMRVTSTGGVTIVVDISPAGWARFFDTSAEAVRDQVLPVEQLGYPGWAQELSSMIANADLERDVKGLLDAFFLSRLPAANDDEDAVARLEAVIARNTAIDSHSLAASVGLTPPQTLKLALQHFGYGPKVLLRRTRFLQALVPMLIADEVPDFSAVPPGYHDVPHFLRDAKLFLGMTPRRFVALRTPYLRSVLRARSMVLGAALPLLDHIQGSPSRPIGRGEG